MSGQNSAPLTTIKDTTANLAPLDLMGFGMMTVLFNIHNARFYGLDSTVLAMGLFFGGCRGGAQFLTSRSFPHRSWQRHAPS
jgi:succinate-acetate transporter protein